MGKANRSKKAKKADFAKVKLKVGKKLKASQNETRTDFKAKKILIKEQLAIKGFGEYLTKKKHNLQDLLSRLSHPNTAIRLENLNGILELVQGAECNRLVPMLPKLLPHLMACILDLDSPIRSSAIKILSAVLGKVGMLIEPYFPIVANHLSCAMVNLNSGIQSDSLTLMQILVNGTPALIAAYCNTLLTNFVNLISRKSSNSFINPMTTGTKFPAKATSTSRMLLTNPANQTTSLEWRLQLLDQLSRFLEAVLKQRSRGKDAVPNGLWQTILVGCSIGRIGIGTTSISNTTTIGILSESDELQKFCVSILQVLTQMWAEVSSICHAAGSVLTADSYSTLKCIVRLLLQLWNIIEICSESSPIKTEWFSSELEKGVLKKIMRGFPFTNSPTFEVKGRKRKRNQISSNVVSEVESCNSINISLALIAVQLPGYQVQHKQIFTFINDLLESSEHDGTYEMSRMVAIVCCILNSFDLHDDDGSDVKESILKSCMMCYSRLHPLQKDKSCLLEILLQATNLEHSSLWSCEVLRNWCAKVMVDLTRTEVRHSVLRSALQLKLRNFGQVHFWLRVKGDKIRENLELNGVVGMDDEEKKKIMNLLLTNV